MRGAAAARECARIMDFPESYVIPGSHARESEAGGVAYESHMRFYHQIGNAVCVGVVEKLARAVLAALAAA